MVIGVDFDGTIVEHEYPRIGAPIPFAIETLLRLQKDGHILILWTVREDELLQEAIDYCAQRGLVFYAANKNYPEEDRATAARKLTSDLFIDDRNVGGLPDWGVIYNAVQAAERGEFHFEQVMMSAGENKQRMRKKNFFIRLGEMFERGGY